MFLNDPPASGPAGALDDEDRGSDGMSHGRPPAAVASV
jgi:hypothetical protein